MTSKSKVYCSVPQCSNYISKTVSMHRFPKDEKQQTKWKIALKIGKPISKYMHVCSEHFLPTDYIRGTPNPQKRYLKRGVVPSQNVPHGSFESVVQKRRNYKKKLFLEDNGTATADEFMDDVENGEACSIERREQKMESSKDHRDFCGYVTESIFNILKHKRQHRTKFRYHPNVFSCDSNLPDMYKCENCDFETNLKVALTHHSQLTHKSLKNENQFRKYVLKQCGFCGFQTYSMLLLLKHCFKCDKRQHLSEYEILRYIINWLECGQCSYKAKGKERSLRNHIKKIHSSNFTFLRCEKCSFKTKNKSYFQKHVNIKHTKLENINSSCKDEWNTCSKGVVWYHCDKCEYKTMRKDHLKLHTINHRDCVDIVWYYCDNCEYKTKWKPCLRQHMANIHTDSANIMWYRCDKCKFKTKRNADLKRHITNIHNDSANIVWYHCDKCTHKTKCKSDLKKHIKNIHIDFADIVWYHCDKCKFKTKWKQCLKKHTANKHTD